jgi:hypothetical protein
MGLEKGKSDEKNSSIPPIFHGSIDLFLLKKSVCSLVSSLFSTPFFAPADHHES